MKSLEQLASEEKTYLPGGVVQKEMSHVPLVCVVGGVGVGKNYLMHLTNLPIVGTMTSRPKRESDDPSVYSYYTNEEFAAMIERQELVQYAVDLPNDAMYGSTLKNYVIDMPNLADVWHWSVVELPEKGFKSVRAVSIITPVKQWQEQLKSRFADRDENYRIARLAEAKKSLSWSKEQIIARNPTHTVIINDKASTEDSIRKLIDFAYENEVAIPDNALGLIDDMLNFLEYAN